MPASQTPTNSPVPVAPEPESAVPQSPMTEGAPPVVEESAPTQEFSAQENPAQESPAKFSGRSSSRYIDWDTHELLEKISEYEDERRWQRIREGIWISIILHIFLFGGISLIPRYILHQPQVIDPFDAIKKRKDLTYLDELPDALKQVQKAKLPPLTQREQTIDKKTMDALKALEKAKPKPPEPTPAPKQAEAVPTPAPPLPPQPAALPPSTATPQQAPQLESPRANPLPAKPNFSLGPQNPSDQLRQAMRNSARGDTGGINGPGLSQHGGAAGGAQILSDTQGVDFGPYLQKVIRETYRTWDPLIPEEVNPPILKRGEVEIVFAILPNGRVEARDPLNMHLTGRSGDVALDRAAWGAIQGADFPPLPREFHGPYLQLRFRFQYNTH